MSSSVSNHESKIPLTSQQEAVAELGEPPETTAVRQLLSQAGLLAPAQPISRRPMKIGGWMDALMSELGDDASPRA